MHCGPQQNYVHRDICHQGPPEYTHAFNTNANNFPMPTNNPILEPFWAFLKTCFNIGVGPTLLVKSIISIIPNDISKCTYTSLNYRGIRLLCTILKVCTNILSVIINNYCDNLNRFVDE